MSSIPQDLRLSTLDALVTAFPEDELEQDVEWLARRTIAGYYIACTIVQQPCSLDELVNKIYNKVLRRTATQPIDRGDIDNSDWVGTITRLFTREILLMYGF